LWKDHTSYKEAEEITKMAAWKLPHYLERIGGTYSSEWSLAKLLRFVRRAPKQVVKATAAWVEIGDYITAMLIGCTDPE
jgi:L-ribulokinase